MSYYASVLRSRHPSLTHAQALKIVKSVMADRERRTDHSAEVRRRSDLHHDYYSLFVRDRASEAMPWELLNKLADVLNALSVYRDDPLGNFAKECDDRARALLARQQRKVRHDTRASPDVSG